MTVAMRADDADIAKALRSLALVHKMANAVEVRHDVYFTAPMQPVLDPWGHSLRGEALTGGYRIVAAGADGAFDQTTWAAAGQFEGLDGDVVFESGKLLRSNRNWLVQQVNRSGESGAALEELRTAELEYMTARSPVVTDIMASKMTEVALAEIGAQVEAHAKANGSSAATFAFPAVHDGWATDLRWVVDANSYRIVSAGSDKKFDPTSWGRPIAAASTAEDLVFANGQLVRSHDERAILKAASNTLAAVPSPQPVDTAPHDPRFARIDKTITPPKVLKRVEPLYSEKYRAVKISGLVIVEAELSETGSVGDVRLLKSVAPDLDQSAMDAVRQWTFAPAMRDGKPIAVLFNLTINFALN